MQVTLIEHMGSDLSVVNAARVSFAKASEWEGEGTLSERDEKLIGYLAKNGHWTPFGHPQVALHVKAPIFVARQLAKHQVGMVWNEVSRRYVTDTPEFFDPEVWRSSAENVKQGSSDVPVVFSPEQWYEPMSKTRVGLDTAATNLANQALKLYESLLADGVCAEQARMVLPQSMYTEWIWTGSLYAWSRVYRLRADSHTQRETREIARGIDDVLSRLFTTSWNALTRY